MLLDEVSAGSRTSALHSGSLAVAAYWSCVIYGSYIIAGQFRLYCSTHRRFPAATITATTTTTTITTVPGGGGSSSVVGIRSSGSGSSSSAACICLMRDWWQF